MKLLKKILLLFVASLFCVSCITTSSVRKRYMSQYVGDEGLQYFIKPFAFEASNHSTLIADFTFRHGELNLNDTVAVNYTIRTNKKEGRIKKCCISLPDKDFEALGTTVLYKEKDNEYVTRYSSLFLYKQLRAAYKEQSFNLKTITDEGTVVYKPTKTSSKLIPALDESIFQLLD